MNTRLISKILLIGVLALIILPTMTTKQAMSVETVAKEGDIISNIVAIDPVNETECGVIQDWRDGTENLNENGWTGKIETTPMLAVMKNVWLDPNPYLKFTMKFERDRSISDLEMNTQVMLEIQYLIIPIMSSRQEDIDKTTSSMYLYHFSKDMNGMPVKTKLDTIAEGNRYITQNTVEIQVRNYKLINYKIPLKDVYFNSYTTIVGDKEYIKLQFEQFEEYPMEIEPVLAFTMAKLVVRADPPLVPPVLVYGIIMVSIIVVAYVTFFYLVKKGRLIKKPRQTRATQTNNPSNKGRRK